MNLYFNPGCALSLYRPEHAETMFRYLKNSFPHIQMHNVCCRHDPKLPEGSVIINVCAGCHKRFSSLWDGISTRSLWEVILELDDFPFPDYHGMEVSVHDPCPVRSKPGIHKAVRDILQKMNLNIIEAEQIGTHSVCCGDSLYPGCDAEKIYHAMKQRAGSMPCEHVVVYCVSCIMAMKTGGKTPCYLLDLLLEKTTVPREWDIRVWHSELDVYIDAH